MKGHVPEENLFRYRRLAGLTHELHRIGSNLSNMGEHRDANLIWALEAKYREKANELRVDIPEQPQQ